MKVFVLISYVFGLFFCVRPSIQAEEILGKIIFVAGDVGFSRSGEKRKIGKGDLLSAGDILTTGQNGIIIVAYGEKLKSRFKLTKNSELKIEALLEGHNKWGRILKRSFFLRFGGMVIEFLNKNKKNRLLIKTPLALMGVRGTKFFAHHEKGRSILAVHNGVVMGKLKGRGVGTPLTSKEGLVFHPDYKEKVHNPNWYKEINWALDEKKGAKALSQNNKLLRAFSSIRYQSPHKLLGGQSIALKGDEKKLEKGCEKGDGMDCQRLGLILLQKTNFKKRERPMKFLLKGCQLKAKAACVWVARLDYEYNKNQQSFDRLKEYCHEKEGYACITLWEFYQGQGKKKKAMEYKKKAVASIHQMKNLDKGLSSFKDSCELEKSAACFNSGLLMEDMGKEKQAQLFYEKACDLGEAMACSNLGLIYQNRHERKKAHSFYQKSCHLDSPEGCYNLACSHAGKKQVGLSLKYLNMAKSFGFSNWKHLDKDNDLAPIRATKEFREWRRKQGRAGN